ncbi:hypothetical protein [Halostella pelagica]|uniref:hypothetical protein n=1 Tax=Halostella pelagica TaxID=2583824 RepID=UPI00108179E3|nr:hypothetical protein [Halostella pelagica]
MNNSVRRSVPDGDDGESDPSFDPVATLAEDCDVTLSTAYRKVEKLTISGCSQPSRRQTL